MRKTKKKKKTARTLRKQRASAPAVSAGEQVIALANAAIREAIHELGEPQPKSDAERAIRGTALALLGGQFPSEVLAKAGELGLYSPALWASIAGLRGVALGAPALELSAAAKVLFSGKTGRRVRGGGKLTDGPREFAWRELLRFVGWLLPGSVRSGRSEGLDRAKQKGRRSFVFRLAKELETATAGAKKRSQREVYEAVRELTGQSMPAIESELSRSRLQRDIRRKDFASRQDLEDRRAEKRRKRIKREFEGFPETGYSDHRPRTR